MATILENVNALSVHLEDAYAALEGKGATIPQQKNATNLSATVDSLPAAGFTVDDLLGTTTKDLVVNVTEIPAGAPNSAGGGAYALFADRNVVSSVDFPNLVKVNSNSCNLMFNNCTSIIEVKSLPATTIASYCYASMFKQATNLRSIPATLPATTLASNCYYEMFRGCTSLSTAPSLPATTLANNCYQGMFQVCTSLTAAPELSQQIDPLQGVCLNMFNGCTVMTGAPIVKVKPATTIANQAFQNMFANCLRLTKVTLDFTLFQTVPSLAAVAAVNVFNSTTDTRLEIRVPAALEESWKGATNWSSWASRIVGV